MTAATASHTTANASAAGQAIADQAAEEGRDALAAAEARARPDRDGRGTRPPAAASAASPGRTARPRATTASVAFSASSSSVAAARSLRPVRSTLVAPMLPEPIVRKIAGAGERASAAARTESSRGDSRAPAPETARSTKSPTDAAHALRRRRLAKAYSCAIAPGNQRQLDPPFHPRRVERRVAAARMQRRRIEHIGLVGIEADQVGRRADREPPAGKPQDFGRPQSTSRGAGAAGEICPPTTSRRLADSMVSRPIAPAAASANGRRLVSTSCGSWSETMTSISPAASASTSAHALVLAAQRRVELEEGAVVADVDLVERQMVDRDAAGDRQARVACARAIAVERERVGDEHGVVARAGQRDEAQVALEHRSSRPRAGRPAGRAGSRARPRPSTPSPARSRSSQ